MRQSRQRVSREDMAALEDRRVAAQEGARIGAAQAQEDDPMQDMDQTDFLSALRNPDIESDEFDELEDILKPHLSGTLVTSYYDEDDRQSIKIHNMALTHRVLKERDRGRLCTGPFLEHAQGVDGRDDKAVKERFTSDERRAVKAALEEVRTAMQNLAIDHVGLSKTADTTVETRVQNMDSDGKSKSRLGRASEKVFGR
ncbi:hypothetical protein [Haloarchaeobius sp. DFWS5]|uniref:hypothetical protein n=1 Tax=Haloarchaeobius sp. DFWS5 TaxID=3446114 RepID=UPI003EBA8740